MEYSHPNACRRTFPKPAPELHSHFKKIGAVKLIMLRMRILNRMPMGRDPFVIPPGGIGNQSEQNSTLIL